MRRVANTVSLLAVALATLTATLAASPAAAQATGDTDSATQDSTEVAANPDEIQSITVTANRREENLQDVPVSVATIDDATLGAISAGGGDIRSLAGRVPSLNIESSFGRTFPRFYIRGLGNTDFDLNASQPVSLLYDDVVLESPILKGFPVFDIDRVQVFRGPQGTLFGRNTPAGIVKFDTVSPTSRRNFARISYGSYNSVNFESAIGSPIGDKADLRVSALYQHRKNWIDNVAAGADNLEGYDDLAVRGQLEFRPTEDLTIRLVGQARVYDGSARVFRANLFRTGSNKLRGIDGGKFDRSEANADGLNFQELKNYNGTVHVEYDAGPVTLYSVTSYWNGNLYSRGDIDGGNITTSPPSFGFIPFSAQSQDNIPSLDQFTQEFRFASNRSGPGFGYQGGLFLFNEKLDIESIDFGSPTATAPSAIVNQRQVSKALGLFGSVNYKLDGGLTLQAGARLNRDRRRLTADRLFDLRPGFVGGGPVAETTTRVKDSVVTWDVSAIQDFGDVNLFARVARGYRAPAIQGRILFDRKVTTADSENTLSFEAGVKTVLLDRRLRFNLTGYKFRTKDLQLSAVGGGTNANLLLNADAVDGYGFEAELEARPARGLTLSAGLSYNSAKIDDRNLVVEACGSACTVLDPVAVPAAPFQPALVNIDGNQLPQAPKWSLNWTAGYEIPVGDGAVYAFTDWYYRSRIQFFLYRSVEYNDAKLLEGGLRLGWRNERFDLAAFGRNITNDKSAVGGIDFNNLTGFVNEPRVFGIEFGAKF